MKNEILTIERKYWEAMANHDFETVKELTFFPCIVASNQGVRNMDEDSFAQNFAQAKDMQMNIIDISQEEVSVISDDYVVLGYVIELEHTMDGQMKRSKCACTSAWARVNGSWKCPLHSETELS